MIALIVAGLVLVVVGGNSYSNYLRSQYEKEYGVLEKHRLVVANPASAAAVATPPAGGNAVTSTLDPSGSLPLASAPVSSAPAASAVPPAQAAYRTESNSRAALPRQSASAPVVDPEIVRLQERLRAVEQESMLYQQKIKQSQGGTARTVANPAASPSLREVMAQAGAAGASPALFPQGGASAAGQGSAKSEFEKQILNAQVAGKVVAFNSDWGFVQIDASDNSNISAGTKFAVRRGATIVGYVKVTEVNDQTAIAELTSRNEFSETARKPKPGDDVITWTFFEEARK